MEHTVRRLAKVLGASGLEGFGHDCRFVVEGELGGRLKISVEGDSQRIMGVLSDAQGVVRSTFDVAPVRKATEDPAFPGRVTLLVGSMQIRIESQPTLAIEIMTIDGDG
jgi:hypothetical protein